MMYNNLINNSTIMNNSTSIKLWGGAVLSLFLNVMPAQADGVKWLEKCMSADKLEISKGTTTIGENMVTVSGTGSEELKVTLKPGESMSMENGQTFVVIEANTTFDKTKKLDHLTVDTENYVNKTGPLLGFNKEVNGHKLTVFSILDKRGGNSGDVEALETLRQFLCDNESYDATEASFYLQPSTALDTDIEIYNIGFYSLGDIFKEYSSLAESSWRYTKSDLSELESYTNNTKTVTINNVNGTTTLAYNYLRARALTNMPDGFGNLDLRNMNLDESQTTAIKQDAFVGLNFSKILMKDTQYKLFPTMNQKVAFVSSSYTAYKDGVSPAETIVATDGNKSVKAYSYTRDFKAGNNSCVLPFDVEASALEALGLKAYTFASVTDNSVKFNAASGTIAAGTPLVVSASEAGLYLINAAETPNVLGDISGYKEAEDANGNKFVGSFVKEVPTAYSNRFALDSWATSFKTMDENVSTTYYRAFLSLKNAPASEAKSYSLDLDDSTTGIKATRAQQANGLNDGAYYTLQGMKMQTGNLPHGMYIHNGKKVLK
jgi:hypothetical protein